MSLRILWVKTSRIWPPTSGGRLRSFHILSALARRHRVTLLTTHDPEDDPDALRAALPACERIVSVPWATPRRGSLRFAVALGRSWWSALPVDVSKFRLPALSREVHRLLQDGAVDLCVADFLSATPVVPLQGPVPVVFFAHNVEHRIWRRLYEHERRPWVRPLLDVEWRKMRRYEARVCAQAALTVAVSEVDRDVLAALAPGARVRAIPTGVDTTYFQPDGIREAPKTIVFVGSMDWYPNEDAVLYFVDTILPQIRRAIPDASFTIVGRDPTRRLQTAVAGKNVHLTGTVEDVRPYVAGSAVCVVPLQIGGGTRLKIFEALAMGKAVVASRVGAEGLPLAPGEHFIQADEPQEFANAVVALLRDPIRRRALGTAGRRLVEERFSWHEVAGRFADLCEETAAARAAFRSG